MRSCNIAAVLVMVVYPSQISSYNTNRQIVLVKDNTCDYYDNPAFQTVPPNFIQSRMKNVAEPTPQVFLVENRIRKETPYYHIYNTAVPVSNQAKYQPKFPVAFLPPMRPVNLVKMDKSDLISQFGESDKEEDEEEENIDYDNLWKVGEIPESRSVQALPDVYVKSGDAPPIVDMLSMEKSELTEETHDLGNVEIGEKLLKDPLSETREVIIEKVTTMPEPLATENPALAMFKEIDLSKMKKDDVKKKQNDKKKKEITTTTETASTLGPNQENINNGE